MFFPVLHILVFIRFSTKRLFSNPSTALGKQRFLSNEEIGYVNKHFGKKIYEYSLEGLKRWEIVIANSDRFKLLT